MIREEAFKYATVLSELGDKITSISALIPQTAPSTIGESRKYQNILHDAIEKYSSCLKELQSTTPPAEVRNEHTALSEVFQDFINGCQFMVKSITIYPDATNDNAAEVDPMMFLTGIGTQNGAVSQTKRITESMTAVFQKHLS